MTKPLARCIFLAFLAALSGGLAAATVGALGGDAADLCGVAASGTGATGDVLCDPPIPHLQEWAFEPAEIVLPSPVLEWGGRLVPSPPLAGYQRLTFGDVGATSTTLINETFESSWPSAGWQVGINSGKADAKWARSTYRKAGGGYSIWCAKSGSAAPPDGGTVPKNMTTWAIVGPINLSSYNAGTFAFDLWQQTGTGDYLFYGASTNGSNFSGWNITTNTSGFQRVTRDITDWGSLGNLAGQGAVWFAFFYISNDDESRAEGAYVDNVTLSAETGGGGGGNCGTYITKEDNENNAGTGTADNDMGVSGKGSCMYNTDSRHPIEFNIFVTGPLPTSSAQLFLETWDVDYPDEINDVYFNNTKVGSTTGANNQWSNPTFSIPLNLVQAGKNTIKVMVDTKNSGQWCTWVAQAQLIIDGGCQGSASCRYVNTNKGSYAPGENVQVTYEIDTTKTSQEIRVESNLKNPSGQIVAGMEKVYTTSGSGNDPQTVTLALPAAAPGGTYKAEVLVFDKATGVLESTCAKEFTVTGGGGGGGCTLSCTATVPATALVGQSVTFASSATASGCTGAIEYFWFFGDGTTAVAQTQNTSYTYTAAGTYTWELVAVVQGNVVCRKTGTITVTTSSGGCSLGCSATVPATAQVGQTVSFQGSASATGCSGTAEYFWFFGDGTTAVAQAQNTSYVYTQPGTYTWELVVVIGQVICRRSGTIIITGTVGTGCTVGCTALVPATGQVNVPVPFKASATTANCQGTPEYFWSVDDGTTAVAQAQNTTWTFPAPGVYRWHLAVVVGGVVCRRTGTITIAASSGCTLDCTALVPAVAQVGQSVSFRGFATWSRCSGPPIYVWDFGDRSIPAGGSTPTHTYQAPGSWEWQMTTVVDGVYCVRSGTIVVPGAGGVQPPPSGCNFSTWFQVGSRAAGALGSQWRTDVFILNLGAQTAQVTARLHAPAGVRTLTAAVPPRQHRTLADVVGQMNYTGSAALEVCSDQPVRAASRTYNLKSATETFGQYYRAFTSAQAMSAGQTGWLLGLKENSQFRSNIALTNSGRSTARVAVTLYDGAGVFVAAYTVTLAPSEWKQEARPFFNKGGRNNIDEGYARIDVLAGSGVEASASAIDAGTNDPTTLPALP